MFDFKKKAMFNKTKIVKCLNNSITDSLTTVFLDLVSDLCNHKCIFCSGKYSDEFKSSYFSKERLFSMLTEFEKLGVTSIIVVGDGGESTLNPFFGDFIKKALEMGFHMGLYTNGCTQLDSYIDFLYHFDFIRVSLDAYNSKMHQVVHGAPKGDFKKAINFIKLMKQKGYRNIGISYIVLNENSKDLYKAVLLANELQVEYIEFKPYYLEDYSLSFDYSYELLTNLVKSTSNNISFSKVIFNNQYKQLLFDSKSDILHNNAQLCLSSRLRLVVSPKGCYFCSCYRGKNKFLIGNPQKQSIVDIWYGKKHEALYNFKCDLKCPYFEQNEFLLSLKNKEELDKFVECDVQLDEKDQIFFL